MRVRGKRDGERREKKKRKGNNTSLYDIRRTGSRNSSGQETKLVHATRATRGYRNPSFSSKLQEVGVFSYTGSSLLRAINGHVVQPKYRTEFLDIRIVFRTV